MRCPDCEAWVPIVYRDVGYGPYVEIRCKRCGYLVREAIRQWERGASWASGSVPLRGERRTEEKA